MQLIINKDTLILTVNGKATSLHISHPNASQVIALAHSGKWDEAMAMANPAVAIKQKLDAESVKTLSFSNGVLMYRGVQFPPKMYDYVINAYSAGDDFAPIVKFMDNLMANPDHRVFQQLVGFMEYGKMPITEDGNFLAFKRVNDNYTSVHDSTFDNTPGKVVSMARNKCNSDPDQTCSTGLHFCSREYLSHFSGSRVVLLEINPKDVVSIPTDYNNTKGRACEYKILRDVTDNTDGIETKSQIVEKQVDPVKEQPVADNNDDAKRKEYIAGYESRKNGYALNGSESVDFERGWNDKKNKKKRKYVW